jgi:hypothetical protein
MKGGEGGEFVGGNEREGGEIFLGNEEVGSGGRGGGCHLGADCIKGKRI